MGLCALGAPIFEPGGTLAGSVSITTLTGQIAQDEVAAHLDPRRRAGLFEALEALPGQVWMTGADPAAFAQTGDRTEVVRIGA